MEECVSTHLHAGGGPASHRKNGFKQKYLGRRAWISVNRNDSLSPAALDPVAMDRNQHTAQNSMSLAVVSGKGSGALLKAGKRVQGLEVVWFGATKTHHITRERNTQGNDFISASGYFNASQCVKPGEAWRRAGATVLGSGATWGVYKTASGEQTGRA